MFMNYLKLAWRDARRRPGFALVNIGGLSIGLAACLLAFLFIRDEGAFDRFHHGVDRIYEVRSAIRAIPARPASPGTSGTGTISSTWPGDEIYRETLGPVGPALAAGFPEVEAATRLAKAEVVVQAGEDIFLQTGLGVDPSFFDLFNFPLARGEAAALGQPDSVFLGREAARLCFGSEEKAWGRTLVIRVGDESADCVVRGILRKIPAHSSLQFDLLVPIQKIKGSGIDQWAAGPDGATPDAACFIRLRKGATAEALEAKFPAALDARLTTGRFAGRHYLFPFARYHRGAGDYPYSSVLERRSSPAYSAILSAIALFILLIAGFNFMNLTVGIAAADRVREIGMRKVLGAGRRSLFRQFQAEGTLMSLAGLAVGLVLASFLLPAFNAFAGKDLRLDILGPGLPLAALILLAPLLGAVAGSYPGWYLSRVRPVDLFRGKFFLGRRRGFSRVLLGLQFALSAFLVITALLLSRQHRLLMTSDLGYEPRRVVALDLRRASSEFQDASRFFPGLKARLLSHPEVGSVSAAASGMASWSAMISQHRGSRQPDIIRVNSVDPDFRETLGLRLKEGRWFSPEGRGDEQGAVVVNETFARHFAPSRTVVNEPAEVFVPGLSGRIIGVVRDFHYDSLRRKIDPAVIQLGGKSIRQVFVRLKGPDSRAALEAIEQEFKAAAPGQPFVYSFLDEDVAREYARETAWSLMIGLVSLLAVLIACGGVFGLAVQSTARKTKEIGIRKVLGASLGQIVGLVGGEFAWVAGAAMVAAGPAAYLVTSEILADYPYRITLDPLTFLAGGLLVVALVLSTVSLQALLAGRRNPAASLRRE
jgi:putative ABC transport system permease protein